MDPITPAVNAEPTQQTGLEGMDDIVIPGEVVETPTAAPIETPAVAETPVAVETPDTPVPTEVDPMVSAAQIMNDNSELLTQIQGFMTEPVTPVTEPTPTNVVAPQPGVAGDESVFAFDDTIVDDVLENPKGFAEHIAQIVSQHVAEQAPMMIQQHMQGNQQIEVHAQEAASSFYANNPSLVGHEETVRTVAENIAAKFPSITEQQLLAVTAQMMNSHVASGVHVTEQVIPGQTVTPLNAQGQAGNVGTAPVLTEEQQDFDTTLNFAANNSIRL